MNRTRRDHPPISTYYRHCLLAFALFAGALTGCNRNPYGIAGCQQTRALPSLPQVTPLWQSEHSVVCVIADNAERVPTCEAISVVYRRVQHPSWNYGVIVTRATHETAECHAMYAPSGLHIGDLPQVD